MEAQTVFAILAGATLACFSLVVVGYSFFRGKEGGKSEAGPADPANDGVDVDAILDSINTLELEYQLGNVPEDQFREQLQSYRLQLALTVKAQLERGEAPPELVLEQEVLMARSENAGGWKPSSRCDASLHKCDSQTDQQATGTLPPGQ